MRAVRAVPSERQPSQATEEGTAIVRISGSLGRCSDHVVRNPYADALSCLYALPEPVDQDRVVKRKGS